jgi:hypothetical protein
MAGDAGAAAFDAAAYDQKIAELVRRRRAKEKRESQQRRRRRQRRRLSLSFLAAPAPPSPPLRPLQRPRDCHQGHALSRGCGIRTNEARYRAKPEPAAASFFSFFLFIRRRTELTPKILLINPSLLSLSLSLFQQNAEGGGEFYSEWEETAESFDQMGLHENLLRGIYAVSRGRRRF